MRYTDGMKAKSFLFSLVFFVLSFSAFAITLPDGQEAAVAEYKQENGKLVAVKITTPLIVSTQYGDIALKNPSIVRWYESGALKSFVPAVSMTVKMPCGTVSVKAVGSKNPVELHENGTLKSGTLASAVELQTPQGKMKTAMNKVISFYDDGSLERFYPASKQQIPFFNEKFSAIFSAAALPVNYSTKHPVEFYKSGAVKSFAAVSVAAPKDIPLTLLADSPITLAENGATISGYPVENSVLEVGGTKLLVVKNTDVSYYENHRLKSATVDYTQKDVSVGNVTVIGSGLNGMKKAKLSFYESGMLESIGIVEDRNASTSFGTSFGKESDALALKIGGTPYAVSSARFFEDGTAGRLVYEPLVRANERTEKRTADVIDPDTLKPKVYTVRRYFSKMQDYFSADGKPLCSVGLDCYEDPRDMGFYNTAERVLYIYGADGKTVAKKIKNDFGTATEICFDADGKPVSYVLNDESSEKKIMY